MPASTASATWQGGLKKGKGSFKGSSGVIGGDYSFATRFEGAKGTNPEELIAAAHASCLSMALSAELEKAGTTATSITTTATVTLEFPGGNPRLTKIRLVVRGKVAGIDQARFQQVAEEALNGCPISNVLKRNLEMELDAKLE
jgi:osmotically inducible protein OsmC